MRKLIFAILLFTSLSSSAFTVINQTEYNLHVELLDAGELWVDHEFVVPAGQQFNYPVPNPANSKLFMKMWMDTGWVLSDLHRWHHHYLPTNTTFTVVKEANKYTLNIS